MEAIVITGSTRGIGLGLARELLKKGCQVLVNGRSESVVQTQTEALAREFGHKLVAGYACDVTRFDEVQAMWNYAVRAFGKVDIWINNAGVMNGHQHTWELSAADLKNTVDINLLGALYGCKVAIQGMLKSGGGHVYNFEGYGSNGRQFHPFMTPYGSTKSAVRYLTRSLSRETRGTSVRVGAIAPGIVVTDLLRDPYKDKPGEWEKAKKIFNTLGDHVETVTPYLAEQVLKTKKSGQNIEWLTTGKVLGKFASALFVKRDLFGQVSLSH